VKRREFIMRIGGSAAWPNGDCLFDAPTRHDGKPCCGLWT